MKVENKDDALIAAMDLVLLHGPECFSLRGEDFYFLGWRLPGTLVVALSDGLEYIEEVNEQPIEEVE